MAPAIKKEPGIEESPRALAQVTPMASKPHKRERSASALGSEQASPRKRKKDERLEKAKASDVWQYLMKVTGNAFDLPRDFTKTAYMRGVMARPRLRDLQKVWITRLASEKPSSKLLKTVVFYLVGDDPGEYLCNSKGANCAEKYDAVTPAMVSWEEQKQEIHKAMAFPTCIYIPEGEESSPSSGGRKCCNASYRESNDPSMPEIWLPRSSPPRQDPTPTRAPSSNAATVPPTNSYPETPRQQVFQGTPAQQNTVPIAAPWEQRNEVLYFHGPSNVQISYAHSAGYLHQRQGEPVPIGSSGTTFQMLELPSLGTTVALPSESQNLVGIVMEGRVEVILQDCPVFGISRGSQFNVVAGKECRVRNPLVGVRTILYIHGMPI
ncbi:hypothetical protein B0T20DRAFT_388176 [Sordaria brevicollis]|uniref:Uncharacterized protein n=1 Tax=Sordaria brevicollis TaxID=83679 RepID=A0AAE0UG11_SORBR|nr:hypothetical protein B0T20DRAFT_388176 [Sordaria brevicollis]